MYRRIADLIGLGMSGVMVVAALIGMAPDAGRASIADAPATRPVLGEGGAVGQASTYITAAGQATLSAKEQSQLAKALYACLASAPNAKLRTVGSARQVYVRGTGMCAADAPTGVKYRLRVQQFNGTVYKNRGIAGTVYLPPGGGTQTAIAHSVCGVAYLSTWRSLGQFFKNGVVVGGTIPGAGVRLSCS